MYKSFETFKESLREGEDSTAKPLAGDSELDLEKSDDTETQLFDEITDKVSACIGTLEGLHKSLEGTKVSQEKIDNIIADLKILLQGAEDSSDISNKSNTIKED